MQYEIIAKLQFLGKIQPNDKIHVGLMKIQPKGLYTSLTRTFFPNNRRDTLYFAKNTIDKATHLLICVKDEKEIYLIKHALNKAIEGLQNLKITYENDIAYVCELNTVIEKLNICLEKTKT